MMYSLSFSDQACLVSHMHCTYKPLVTYIVIWRILTHIVQSECTHEQSNCLGTCQFTHWIETVISFSFNDPLIRHSFYFAFGPVCLHITKRNVIFDHRIIAIAQAVQMDNRFVVFLLKSSWNRLIF